MLTMGDRMHDLENRMGTLETGMDTRMKRIEDNTAGILDAVTFSRNTFGYVRKYGPKAITFGAGIMTAAGLGNPKIWAYIGTFFT